MGAQSASTVVYALSARSAVGLKSASTVVYAIGARIAVGLESPLRRECSNRLETAPRGGARPTSRRAGFKRSRLPSRVGCPRASAIFRAPLPSRLSPSPRVSDGRPREHLARRRTRSFAPERKLGRAARVRRSVPASSVKPSDKTQSRKTTKKGPYPCLVPAHERLWCAQSSRAHASPQYL